MKSATLLALAGMVELASAFTAPSSPMPLRQQRDSVSSSVSRLNMVKVTISNAGKEFEMEQGDILRSGMQASGNEVYYTMKGKLFNCNGGGQCGTCKVEVQNGNVSGRTDAENKLLANDPPTFRLACQTLVNGPCTIRNKPDA
mmetsp:Transcript_25704/g.59625  ORF Transcript_25704/g.59625 Transcript_25704/m.59625 type:complete len:143 (-) Transcript_25704:297-725(-)|eukprot:CAMPEP_0114147008 /NCGR_PEP_ID=MMETSP0043_2-20121206/20864_1 /TAXON_ID=464988 /ORGANISM="Hemiselmis andersenii, Strain CCMP644" /LENGTH=142 /DNA_ID=CAMNT_0001241491 /DNA_START=31 /DNA_END=459 /DNA_ORIENTATION=+